MKKQTAKPKNTKKPQSLSQLAEQIKKDPKFKKRIKPKDKVD